VQGKIGLEEHFAIPQTLQDSAGFLADESWTELSARLIDMQERRLREMDDNGMEMMILSLNAPTIQAIHNRNQAIEMAKRDSVTVSMADDSNGMLISMRLVMRVLVFTPLGTKSDSPGSRRTSS
jgi:hypothetical protein